MSISPLFPSNDYRQGANQGVGRLPGSGKGVTVAVFDSGVAPHQDLGDRLLPAHQPEFTLADLKKHFPQRSDEELQGRLEDYKSMSSTPDPMGHGTMAAGIIAGDGTVSEGEFTGLAPQAKIQPIQVLAGGPQVKALFFEGAEKGLNWMVDHRDEHNIRVANFSIGMPLQNPGQEVAALIDPLSASIHRAVEAGIVVVAAAGNFGPAPNTIVDSPAMNPEVITVGGYDPRGEGSVLAPSSRGVAGNGEMKPDLIAPALGIVGPIPADSTMVQAALQSQQARLIAEKAEPKQLKMMAIMMGLPPQKVMTADVEELRQLITSIPVSSLYEKGDQVSYMSADGTSFAAPNVSGVVADMLEINPALTPGQVKAILKETAKPLPGVAQEDQGAGLLQPFAALERASQSLSANS